MLLDGKNIAPADHRSNAAEAAAERRLFRTRRGSLATPAHILRHYVNARLPANYVKLIRELTRRDAIYIRRWGFREAIDRVARSELASR